MSKINDRRTEKSSPSENTKAPAFPGAENEKTTESNTITVSFLLLKDAIAQKLGQQSEDTIAYQILCDSERSSLSIRITKNDSGGYFSKEILPFEKIEVTLAKQNKTDPFPSKALQEAFIGRSSNNAGFLAAILRAEGLLVAAEEYETKHVISGNRSTWKESLLSGSGELIEIEIGESGMPVADSSSARKAQPQTSERKTLSVKRMKPDAQLKWPSGGSNDD